MSKYVCVHGHFYQPPRENPWLEDVELQESAYPYHDWNERITAESYEPNTAARVVDVDSKIVDIVNNYSRISFNFGPTLLSWMQKHRGEVYKAVIKADKDSRKRFSGHGSAIAQAYSHMIMPLANSRDKRTQVLWGMRDFRNRFKRDPEGMWLPETAVDHETLEIMVEVGIKFTILAPRQARRVKDLSDAKGRWHDLEPGTVDPRRNYLCRLPNGAEITVFFYDGNIAHDVAFGKMLSSGEALAQRIMGTLDDDDRPQIANIATDGETFGHHQAYGEMTLAYALSYIDSRPGFKLTNYSEYISMNEPAYEVELHENSSWSCVHGVERWRDDCGCNSGGHSDWHQRWRKPLREALDGLREALIGIFEAEGGKYFTDPWAARDDYIDVILDRREASLDKFLAAHAGGGLSEDETVRVLKLLEMQRFAMLMYTSCGWFFDEISGIETMQVMQYAARALQLAKELGSADLEERFVSDLAKAPSNIPAEGDGAALYRKYIQNCMLDPVRVGAHFAISSFFEKYPPKTRIYCYEARTDKLDQESAGKHALVCGRADIRSLITREEARIGFAVMHLGDHNVVGGVTRYEDDAKFEKAVGEIKAAFNRVDVSATIELIRKHLGQYNYTLWHLFKDEQRKVLDKILKAPLSDIERDMKKFQTQYYPVLKAVRRMRVPLPPPIKGMLELISNVELQNLLQKKRMKLDELDRLLEDIALWGVELAPENLYFVINSKVTEMMEKLKKSPEDIEHMRRTEQFLSRLGGLEMDLKLWKAKNIYFFMSRQTLPQMKEKAAAGEEGASVWVEAFTALAGHLGIKL